MKSLLIFLLSLLFTISLTGQIPNHQKVDYDIYAVLDPENKTLRAYAVVMYHNNSDTELSELYFHLWANAYRSRFTSLAKDFITAMKPDLYFLPEKALGGYEEIIFKQDSDLLGIEYMDPDGQIARVKLKKSVAPREHAQIFIEYVLKIPKDINGFGFSGNLFNMTHWHPKAAVFREGKWHTHLINMENAIFSDIGKYHITLDVPVNYEVAASGEKVDFMMFIDPEWEEKMDSTGYKKISFMNPGTKDFAWIASPDFQIISTDITIPQAGTYSINYYFDRSSGLRYNTKDLNVFVIDALNFINDKTGFIPNNNTNIVASRYIVKPSAWPGLITSNLYIKRNTELRQREILAENLFRMFLSEKQIANPVRKPWKYDGLGRYYFTRFMEEKYDDKKELSSNFQSFNQMLEKMHEICFDIDMPADLYIDDYSDEDYTDKYLRNQTASNFNHLENTVGSELFDQKMRQYFIQKPGDKSHRSLREHFESDTGKTYDWFFDGMMSERNAFDYRITEIRRSEETITASIENKGRFQIPYQIGLMKGREVIEIKNIEGHYGTQTIEWPRQKSSSISLDPNNLSPKSMLLKTSARIGKPHFEPVRLSFNERIEPSISTFPIIGYNENDGFQAGLGLSGNNRSSRYYLFPLYAFRSKSPTGLLDAEIIISKTKKGITSASIEAQSFHRMHRDDFQLRYYKFSPSINFYIIDKSCDCRSQDISYGFSLIGDQAYTGDAINNYQRYINRFYYETNHGNIIFSHQYRVGLEHQYYNYTGKRHYLMAAGQINTRYMYKKNRHINARLYAATYLYNTHRNNTGTMPGTLSLVGYNINDYGYDSNFFVDRSAQTGFWSRQLITNTGGFKTAVSNAYGIGQSNNYVASLNLRIDPPFGGFVKPFFDLGIYGYLPTVSEGYQNEVLYSAGFVFEIIKDAFEIYLPLFNSAGIEDRYKEMYKNTFWGKFSFSILDVQKTF